VPLFVLLVIYYCCSLIIAPHRFLQVRGNYIRCILWYIVCCCFPHQYFGSLNMLFSTIYYIIKAQSLEGEGLKQKKRKPAMDECYNP